MASSGECVVGTTAYTFHTKERVRHDVALATCRRRHARLLMLDDRQSALELTRCHHQMTLGSGDGYWTGLNLCPGGRHGWRSGECNGSDSELFFRIAQLDDPSDRRCKGVTFDPATFFNSTKAQEVPRVNCNALRPYICQQAWTAPAPTTYIPMNATDIYNNASSSTVPSSNESFSLAIEIGIAVSVALVLLLAAIATLFVRRQRRAKSFNVVLVERQLPPDQARTSVYDNCKLNNRPVVENNNDNDPANIYQNFGNHGKTAVATTSSSQFDGYEVPINFRASSYEQNIYANTPFSR